MYNPPDIRWDVLNNRMSSYYVCYYHISGLNGVAGGGHDMPFKDL